MSIESLIRYLELARIDAYTILADQISREKPEVGLLPGDSLPKTKYTQIDQNVHLLLYPELPPLKSQMTKSDTWYRKAVRDRTIRSVLSAVSRSLEPVNPATVLFVYRLPKNITWPDPDNLERKPILDALRYAGFIHDDRLGRLTLIETASESTVPHTAVFVLPQQKTVPFMSEIENHLKIASRHIEPVLPACNIEVPFPPDPRQISDTDKNENYW